MLHWRPPQLFRYKPQFSRVYKTRLQNVAPGLKYSTKKEWWREGFICPHAFLIKIWQAIDLKCGLITFGEFQHNECVPLCKVIISHTMSGRNSALRRGWRIWFRTPNTEYICCSSPGLWKSWELCYGRDHKESNWLKAQQCHAQEKDAITRVWMGTKETHIKERTKTTILWRGKEHTTTRLEGNTVHFWEKVGSVSPNSASR